MIATADQLYASNKTRSHQVDTKQNQSTAMTDHSPAFHPEPYREISTHVDDPRQFVNELYRTLLEARPYFPGDTNCTGFCIDDLMTRLEGMGATSEFEDD